MNRRIIHKLVLSLVLVAACSQGGQDNPNNNNPEADMAIPDGGVNIGGDGGMSGGDGGGGGKPDMTVLVGIPCTPGTYRCSAANAVEICNSSGTAWLFNKTCTVSCSAGLCTGACTAGEKRCNGKNVETCNTTGSAYTLTETCTTFCDNAICAIPSLEVATNKMLDGDQLVDGDIIIRSGATLTSPAGDLTLRTRGAIMVEMGASIVVNPTGRSPGGVGSSYTYGGSGGGYGTAGASGYYAGGVAWGSTTDANVQPGSAGGTGYTGGTPGSGGGVLRLIAGKSITVAGQVTANGASGGTPSSYGAGGGGSGGGILVATPDKIIISGSIAASGGSPGYSASYPGGAGGLGRVKILNGSLRTITGTINATQTVGLIPPTQITSSSHPSPALVYNDAFPALLVAWNQAFTGLQGYYYKVSENASDPPTPANGGKVVTTESVTIPASSLQTGANWLHIVPIDAMSTVGTIENTFQVTINDQPPTVASMSHPSPTTWYPNGDVFFNWTFPVAEKNFKGIYYVLDHYGDTMPTSSAATLIPVTQKMLLRGGLADGLWVIHMVPIDQQNYLTKQASHFRVQVGMDPGKGTILGQVVDVMGKPMANAKVTVNRGLWSMYTNAMGSYNFMTQVPTGTWEIRATSADGMLADIKTDTVTKGGTTTVNLTLK